MSNITSEYQVDTYPIRVQKLDASDRRTDRGGKNIIKINILFPTENSWVRNTCILLVKGRKVLRYRFKSHYYR